MLPLQLSQKITKIDDRYNYWAAIWNEESIAYTDYTGTFMRELNIPVIVFNFEDKKYLPIFLSGFEAARFSKRNLHKDCLIGTLSVNELFKKEIVDKDIIPVLFDFPTKIISFPGLALDAELFSIEKGTEIAAISR